MEITVVRNGIVSGPKLCPWKHYTVKDPRGGQDVINDDVLIRAFNYPQARYSFVLMGNHGEVRMTTYRFPEGLSFREVQAKKDVAASPKTFVKGGEVTGPDLVVGKYYQVQAKGLTGSYTVIDNGKLERVFHDTQYRRHENYIIDIGRKRFNLIDFPGGLVFTESELIYFYGVSQGCNIYNNDRNLELMTRLIREVPGIRFHVDSFGQHLENVEFYSGDKLPNDTVRLFFNPDSIGGGRCVQTRSGYETIKNDVPTIIVTPLFP